MVKNSILEYCLQTVEPVRKSYVSTCVGFLAIKQSKALGTFEMSLKMNNEIIKSTL